MPVDVTLHENNRIAYFKFSDPVDMDELAARFEEGNRIRDSIPFKIHVLADMRDVTHTPDGVMRVRRSPAIKHPNAGHLVVVGNGSMMRTIIDLLISLERLSNVKQLENIEEGWAYLRSVIAEEDRQASVNNAAGVE